MLSSSVLTLYSTLTVPSVFAGVTVYVTAVTLPSFCDKLSISIVGVALAISNVIVKSVTESSAQA